MDHARNGLYPLILGDPAEPEVALYADALQCPAQKDVSLLEIRGRIVHVIGDRVWLETMAWRTTQGAARGVLATPTGELGVGRFPRLDRLARTSPFPWWNRRFHRFIVPNQGRARALLLAGLSLGRIVVAQEKAGLMKMYEEVRRMHTRA